MKKLNTYIVKQIIVGYLLVSFSLMSIIWLSQSLRFVDLLTNTGLSIGIFIEMTSLLMPRIYTILSPISLFAAVLFVYNRMLSDRELVVMKAAGINPWDNAKPAIYVGIFLCLFNFYVLNIVIPYAENKFNDLQWQVKNDVSHLIFREGQFTEIQPNLTIFISKHEPDGSMSNLLLNDERNPKNKSTLSAEKGRIVYTSKGPRVILVNGIRQEIDKQNHQFSSLSFKRYSVDLGYNKTQKEKSEDAREKTTWELLNSNQDKSLSEGDVRHYIVTGHKRLLNPFYNLLFAIIGCLGLVIGNFNRRGQTKIISLSILSMVILQSLSLTLENLAAKNLGFLIGMYLNFLLPLAIVSYLTFFYNPAQKKKHLPKGEELNDKHK